MDIDLVHPEIRGGVARMSHLPLARRGAQIAANLLQAAQPAAKTPGTVVETIRDAQVTARVLRPAVRPAHPTGAVLWLHGGGFVVGTVKSDAVLLGRTSAQLGIPTFSVRYPLAPRAKVPDMVQAGYRAWLWLVQHAAEHGVDPDRIVVGGESAGAQLASVLVQYIHDQGGRQPRGQWLFAPATDDRMAVPRPDEGEAAGSHFVIDLATYRQLVPQSTGHPVGADDMPPYVFANRRQDLSGLPPAWIYVGSVELFRDEAVTYAHRLQAAGVPTVLHVVDGAVHGFELLMPRTALAQRLFDSAIDWLGGVLR